LQLARPSSDTDPQMLTFFCLGQIPFTTFACSQRAQTVHILWASCRSQNYQCHWQFHRIAFTILMVKMHAQLEVCVPAPLLQNGEGHFIYERHCGETSTPIQQMCAAVGMPQSMQLLNAETLTRLEHMPRMPHGSYDTGPWKLLFAEGLVGLSMTAGRPRAVRRDRALASLCAILNARLAGLGYVIG